MTLDDITEIPLTKRCWMDINSDGVSVQQYASKHHCPIRIALKLFGIPVAYVDIAAIIQMNGNELQIKGTPGEVERCRQELLDGADVAYIQIIR